MKIFLSSRPLVALSLVISAVAARAVSPWTLLVNTNNVINATSYGAVGDGSSDNTTAIQNAINQAAKGGQTNGLFGGTVEIPGPGIYMCGPLNMSNYVNLQVDTGVILRMLPYGSYPGAPYTPTDNVPDFIYAYKLHDIAVSGPGAIDGQGAPWWPGYATNNRPIMISFSGCNRQLIQNITLSNSPMFHIAIGGSGGNKTVQGVIIRAPSSSDPVNPGHNTDACDVGGTNILVQSCNISVGDDDFTCGGNTHDVLITNNVYGNGHGVSIGSYTSGGVSDITVINCSFNGTDNGVRIKSQRGRGGLVQNINYLNLTMTNVSWPLLVYGYYEYGLGTLTYVDPSFAANVAATNSTPLTSTTPIFHDITFSNIVATMPAGRPPLMVWALPEAPASNIVFRDINIISASALDPGVYNATNVQFIDCSFNLPTGVKTMQFWNANLIFTNTPNRPAAANLWLLDGLTTNGIGNSLQFYNALGTLSNTNALDDGPLTLSASTFTVSNNLSLFPNNMVNFVLSTNTTRLAVTGNLTLGGTNNIYAGPGFTNGTYTLMTCAGVLSGTLPVLGDVPGGHYYQFDTNTARTVKLVVTTTMPAPAAPGNLTAIASNALVSLNWSASATATNYTLKRSLTSGAGYAVIASLAGTSYSDTQVTNGRTYYYIVSASNDAGESANSAEVSATPKDAVFNDSFSTSSLNSPSPSAPTAAGTSYQLISSKAWNPAPTITAGHLKFGIGATGSGLIEVQALFASSPVTLATIGDTVSLSVTFTNTVGLFAQTNYMGFGLYNSGQNGPVPGGLNGTATSGTVNTSNATGNAQNWVGYVGQLNFTNASSLILTRVAQNGTANNNQELLTTGSSASYNNPPGSAVGAPSGAASIVLPTNSLYTAILTITLKANNTLAITNSLYSGADDSGTLLSQFGAVASGSAYLTNRFDALAIGWRAAIATGPTMIDINNISVTAGVGPSVALPPPAPGNLQASPTNLLINLNWNSVAGATNYNLKRGTVSGVYPAVFSGLTATNYADATVTNAVTYYYVVTAVGTGGESANSLEAIAVPLPSNQPTNLTAQVVGNQLQLSWPQDHQGWLLQVQTNTLSGGLGTNWVPVSNSTNVISTNILINPANGSVFYRMIYP
jgi:fibronectin type 3 domain-containing protein